MAKPPLSMKPTGWFQVAWSDEIGVGDVHTMKYFDQEMVAWRAESGELTVMNAYCEHLGAHLGYGGKVVGEVLQCPFHGWQWSQRGPQRLHPVPGSPQPWPAHPHLPRGGAQRVGLHLARRRGSRAVLRRAGRVRRLRRRQQRRRLLPAAAAVPREPGTASAVRARKRGGLRALQVRAQHPDRAGLHPPRLRRAGVLRRLHHHLRRRRRPEDRGRQQRRGGHQRRSGHRGDQELGHGRQPHHLGDHPGRRVHLRCPVHGLHRPHAGQGPANAPSPRRRSSDRKSSGSSSRTSTSGRTSAIRIHPRWPPTSTRASPQFATWAKQFYPDGIGGSAAEVYAAIQKG